MKQILQYPREQSPTEVVLPDPVPQPGMVLIRNRASLISSGTERASVQLTRASLLEKARRRPDLVRRVISKARTQGIAQTWRQARHRLDTPLSPGYSCCGIVIGVGDGVTGFRVGDRVTAAGQGLASHAEVVNVPVNLVCRLPENVPFADGAFVAVGAVALHGVRTAHPQIGETVAVIGLGLLGQLTVQILAAQGCRVIGIDPVSPRRTLAETHGAIQSATPAEASECVRQATGGMGADAVIVCAASDSNTILDMAADLARERAVVVSVGAVPLVAPRDLFYRKELQLRVSRSYGPGRYDPAYEDRGEDYPAGYVRWTENRNMQAFLDLLNARRVDVHRLITHRFELNRSAEAYAAIEGDPHVVAVIFEYPETPDPVPVVRRLVSGRTRTRTGVLGVSFWGAGRFAGGVLAPLFARHPRTRLLGVATQTPASAARAMKQHDFTFATCQPEELLNDPETDIVVIATPHSQHAAQVVTALKKGKAVFLEKPMAISREELRLIVDTVAEEGGRVQVGFNRRYSPAVQGICKALASFDGPRTVVYRVAAGPKPVEGWLSDPREGGRLIGEVAHFADTIQCLTSAWPRRVVAERLGGAESDGVSIIVSFMDGSVGTIIYTCDGHPATPKEHVEVHCGGVTATIDDYRHWTVQTGARLLKNGTRQDKGHKAQVDALIASVRSTGLAAGDFAAAVSATEVTFAAAESLRTGEPVAVQPWF